MPEGVGYAIDESLDEVPDWVRMAEARLGTDNEKPVDFHLVNDFYRKNQGGMAQPTQSQATTVRPSNSGVSGNSGTPLPPSREDMEAARNGAQVPTAEGEASIEDEASGLSPWWLGLLGARALVPGQRSTPGEATETEEPRQLTGRTQPITNTNTARQLPPPDPQVTDQRPQPTAPNEENVNRVADGDVIAGGDVNAEQMTREVEQYRNAQPTARRRIARGFRDRYGISIQDALSRSQPAESSRTAVDDMIDSTTNVDEPNRTRGPSRSFVR